MSGSTDRVALITGASAGIGLAVAKVWVAQGGRAALVARTEKTLREAVEALGGESRALAFVLDVADLRALEALPLRVVERFGRLDLLVNNAGLHHRGPMMSRTAQELGDMITVNLTAPVVLTRAAAPLIGQGGAVVNVASLAGMVPVHHAAAYSASKAGLRAFGRVIADELRERQIRVATVSPGPVDTGFFGDLDLVPDLVFSQPMKSAEQVALAVLAAARGGKQELALPWLSGKLCTLGYLSPFFLRALRPLMQRRGAREKATYQERRRQSAAGAPPRQDQQPRQRIP